MSGRARGWISLAMVLALAGCGGDGERPSGGGGMTGAAPAPGPAAGLAPAPGAGSAPGTPPSPVPTTQPTAEPEIAPSLDRLRVVYIGGSITEGAFSTVSEKSYASLLTAWLATHYRTVDARNFGFGGTGSDFAAYRIDHDLAGFAPDLAFLEFSVNDAGKSRAQIYAYLDAIVTKLRQTNPHVKVVYISTTDVGEEPDRRAGRRAAFVENSVAAAAFLDIPFIDASAGFWAKVLSGVPASTYLADAVHPRDEGHQLYFESVRDGLAPMIPLGAQPSIRTGRLIDRSGLANARMDKGSNAAGCRSGTLPLRYMETALACDRGESFTYRFTGRRIGMVRAMVRDGGRLACTLDGGRPTTVDFYDETVPTYERPYPTFLYGDLSAGPHDLACRVTDDVVSTPRGRSTGHKATIGYFLVSDEQAVTLP